MNQLQNIDDELKRRIALVQQDIYSTVYTSTASNRLYINEVINTLIALIQAPVFFGLYREKNNSLSLIYHSSNKHKIRKELEHINTSSTCEENDWCPNTFIRLTINARFKTKHFIKVVRIATQGNDYEVETVKSTSTNPIDQYIWRCMEYIFKNADENWGHLLNKYNTAKFWQAIFKPSPESRKPNQPYHKPQLDLKNDERIEEQSLKQINNQISTQLDKTFDKLEKVTEFIQDIYGKSAIPNFFIAVNFNTSSIKRYCRPDEAESQQRHHNYSLAMVLGAKQQQEIINYFTRLKNKTYSHNLRLYKTFIEVDPNYNALIADMDKWFWQNIKQNNTNELIAAFTDHLGQSAQSFCDLVIDSGISYFDYPYANSGLHRLDPNALGSINKLAQATPELARELKRIVVTHYIISGMVPPKRKNARNDKLVMLLNPIEVGGATWAVIGHMLYVDEQYAKTKQEWYAKFNFITTLRRKLGKNIRKKIQELHLKVLERVFTAVFFNFAEQKMYLLAATQPDKMYIFLQNIINTEIKKSNLHLYSPYRVPIFTENGMYVFVQGLANVSDMSLRWSLLNSFYDQPHFRERAYISIENYKLMLDRAFIKASLKVTVVNTNKLS